jgi:ubiquinone biosynthesis protein
MLEVHRIAVSQLARFGWRKARGEPAKGPELVREGFEELGGSFLKFGQILSLQIDTLPKEYCDTLLALLDRVPQFPKDQVDEVFREQLQAIPTRIFEEFDYKAVASASIGQVHRARLKDGTPVAVKVQRPGIRAIFERDNSLLRFFIRVIFLFRIRRLYFMRDPVRELSTWTQDELDYRREAAYAQMLGDNAKATPTERIPRVYWDLTRQRVLTMDFLEGPSVATYLRMVENNDHASLDALREKGFIPSVFSSNVISNFLSDAFRFGVFHADLHPANLLILPNNVVGYVDFGIVATLTREARRKQIELTLAYSSGNPEAIYEGFLNICIVGPEADLEGMRRRISELADSWYSEPAIGGKVRFRVTVTKTMLDLLSICQDYGVLVDREMIKYIRSTILADGLVSRLAPEFDLAKVLRKVVEDYLSEEAQLRAFSRAGMMSMLTDLALWMQAGPAGVLHALNLFERRQFKVHASVNNGVDKDSALRGRVIAVGLIWGVTALAMGFFTGPDFWSPMRFPAILAGIFLALWTLWLLRLLQRLSTR